MGYDVHEVGYLSYCGQRGLGCADWTAVRIVGNAEPRAIARCFSPHPMHEQQRSWPVGSAERLLQTASVERS